MAKLVIIYATPILGLMALPAETDKCPEKNISKCFVDIQYNFAVACLNQRSYTCKSKKKIAFNKEILAEETNMY